MPVAAETAGQPLEELGCGVDRAIDVDLDLGYLLESSNPAISTRGSAESQKHHLIVEEWRPVDGARLSQVHIPYLDGHGGFTERGL